MTATTRTPNADDVFFETFEQFANVSLACQISGYTRSAVYRYRKDDELFEQRWQEADRVSTENLEAAMYQRAVFGVTRSEPVMYKGKIVVTKEITEYSDTLAIFLAKARDPNKYREKLQIDINWQNEVKQLGVDPDELFKQMVHQAMKQITTNGTDEILEGEIIDGSESESAFDTDRSESETD